MTSFVFGLGILLNCVSSANALESACRTLFSAPPAQELAPSVSLANTSLLNDASREFLTRLKYLTLERRLLDAEVFRRLIASPQPINPLGERPSRIELLPHQQAFASLLAEPLQWEQIREHLRPLARSAETVKQRKETATTETETVLTPVVVKSFPVTFKTVLKTTRGQILGVSTPYDRALKTTSLITYDLPSGLEISRRSFSGRATDGEIETHEVGTTVIASAPAMKSRSLITFDLMAKQAEEPLSNPSLQDAHFAATGNQLAPIDILDRAHYLDFNGSPLVATFIQQTCYFFNPLTGAQIQRVPYPSDRTSRLVFSGRLGDSVFASDSGGISVVMNPASPDARPLADRFFIMKGLTFNKKAYALGIDQTVQPSETKRVALKVIDVETGIAAKAFELDASFTYPEILQTFEQDGNLYAAIATHEDLYIVNLLKGEIVQQLSKSPKKGMRNNFMISADRKNQIGFEYRGKTYLIGLSWLDDEDLARLVIFDALTLEMLGPGILLNHDLLNVRMLPADGDERAVIANYHDGTSQWISLVNTFDRK